MNQIEFNALVYHAVRYYETTSPTHQSLLLQDYAEMASHVGQTKDQATAEISAILEEVLAKVDDDDSNADGRTLVIQYFSEALNQKWQNDFQYIGDEIPLRQTLQDPAPGQVALFPHEETDEDDDLSVDNDLSIDNHRDVIIVGAGPVGLAFAAGLKNLNPDLRIRVYEKYPEYQRKHTLVVQHEQVAKYIREAGFEADNEMQALLATLRTDPNIRTSTLEEILKGKAQALGVEIVVEEIKEETIHQQIGRHTPRFVTGADGTHSVVSRAVFGPDNQVKHEFDYVLQLRYEIEGEARADRLDPVQFYEQMAQEGIIASEYVGTYDAAKGTTPVTMQMMISKEEFQRLSPIATSKNPVYLYTNTQNDQVLPVPVANFLHNYMLKKIQSTGSDETIVRDSVRVSVNEAPATHAKQVFRVEEDGSISQLKGDAALGLSYFKGINAAFEALGKWFNLMAPSIRKGLPKGDQDMLQALSTYQSWFLTEFVPRKIKEVEKYSTWMIRAPMLLMEVVHSLADASVHPVPEDKKPMAEQFFNAMTGGEYTIRRRLFPHRAYDPVPLWQWSYVPVTHSLTKVWKLVADYFKPYKSEGQRDQDFRQPLVGAANILIGSAKILVGFFQMFTLDFKRFGDGLFTFSRGLFEIATTPLAWIVKPLTREIATIIHNLWRGPKQIEDNHGMHKLANTGMQYLQALEGDALDPVQKRDIYGYCNDLHRKFIKSQAQGQSTKVEQDEGDLYSSLSAQNTNLRSVATNYFSLFNSRRTSASTQESQHNTGLNPL
jgi:2-polyprenyl-6-methoxyphenol hydroxylase-like FAD-dependent oxidoreductase